MKIGNIEISGYASLAPMAGVADAAMRELCAFYGAGFTVGELTSAKGVSMGDKKSEKFLHCFSNGVPYASQIFGSSPEIMAIAAAAACEKKPDFIDINMGCPAPKVALNGCGSALLKNPDLAGQIVNAVVKASSVPVTVKIRLGWDENSVNAVKIAKICEFNGAAALTVHGRTRNQMYSGKADLSAIADVKKAVNIPVIANGDVTDALSCKNMYDITGCDYVAVGRGAMGNPFIFREINEYMSTGVLPAEPTPEEKLDALRKQVLLMLKYKDERTAINESRKHAAWYLKGFRGAAALRRECGEISCFDDIEKICAKALAEI